MGPDLFGRYALLTSVSMWFAMLSGLGAVSLMTRTVPQFTAAGDTLRPAQAGHQPAGAARVDRRC